MGLGSGSRDPGSEIQDPGSGKNLFRIPDAGVKTAPDPGSGSATLHTGLIFVKTLEPNTSSLGPFKSDCLSVESTGGRSSRGSRVGVRTAWKAKPFFLVCCLALSSSMVEHVSSLESDQESFMLFS